MGNNRDSVSAMIGDLVVIDYQSDDLPQQISEWKRNTIAPYGQNCRRNLYYGFSEDFEDFPYDKLDRDYTDLGGAHAYAHLLQFASGFERGKYNGHNRYQFFEAWAQSTKNRAETGEKYGHLLSLVTNDTKFMERYITSKYKARRLEISARDLSGMTKGDDVLVVGHLNKNDDLSPFTSGMIRIAESKQKGRKNFISVTHPDPDTLEKLKEAMQGHVERGNIRSGIEFVDFENLPIAVEINNSIYVAMPMGEHPEGEAAIIDAWNNRSEDQNTLTHLHGEIGNQGAMSSLWEGAELDNFTSPYDIREDMSERARYNAEVIVKAEQAFWKCAELRSQGEPLTKDSFFGSSPELIME